MRLIDANKLLQEIEFDYDLDYGETLIDPRDFADAVCDSPTVDAVPVVRCKECKHMRRDNVGVFCKVWNGYNGFGEDGFCSYGEKRET